MQTHYFLWTKYIAFLNLEVATAALWLLAVSPVSPVPFLAITESKWNKLQIFWLNNGSNPTAHPKKCTLMRINTLRVIPQNIEIPCTHMLNRLHKKQNWVV